MHEIEISEGTIRLGQLLKLASLAEDGAAAKAMLGAEEVLVNGEVDTRRGHQLAHGDEVTVGTETVRVVAR